MLFTGCIALFSCQASEKNSGEFNLLPAPQKAAFTGTSALMTDAIRYCYGVDECEVPVLGEMLEKLEMVEDPQKAQVLFEIGEIPELKQEAYMLSITKNRVSIKAVDEAGLFYAFMTLAQLMVDAADQGVPLPICKIEDYPLLSYRAVHLDMKHHREKIDYYFDMVDKLSYYKVNAIIAEVEDKLGYERQSLVGAEDALSMEQWKKLSAYAMERNIEISPLVQGLGHASFILKHEQYKDLRDNPESDWAFNPLDPRTYELQFDLFLDAMEAMPHGRYLHVGGDEVHTTGRGSGKSELELQLTWLNKVCEFAEAHGRIPIFWDDMPIKYAGLYRPMFNPGYSRAEVDSMWAENEHRLLESLDMFPRNCIYMRWNYSAPQAEGNIKAMEWFSEHGLEVMGATAGQTRWVLMPQDESNMENIRSFTRTTIEKGIDGLLLTLWDDDSPHFELYWRGILAFAEYSWSGEQRSKDEIKAAYRQREYGFTMAGEEYGFVDQLEPLVGWWNTALLKGRSRNGLRSMQNPVSDGIIEIPAADQKGRWSESHAERIDEARKVMKECETISETISLMKQNALRNQYRLEVYSQVNALVKFSASSLLILQTYDMAQNEMEEAEALGQIEALPEEFARLTEELERVYGETRILNKPDTYILDQDHHQHLANQSLSFDWLYISELYFLDKVVRDIY